MVDDHRMSRRDWFRLLPRQTERTDAQTGDTQSGSPQSDNIEAGSKVGSPELSMRDVPNGLHPVAHPVNHDGMDLSELPPMREAFLSEEQVRQLFSDIESLASDILLMQRSARSQRAAASKVTTAEQLCMAQDSLLSGDVPRVQIRYHWQEANWIDTLERRDDGVRLIRIAHNATAAATRLDPKVSNCAD